MVSSQPSDLKGRQLTHRMFVNTMEVYEPTMELLKKLGDVILHAGLESEALLPVVGKGRTTLEDNERLMRLSQKYGIKLILSFVLGLPGETSETLTQNLWYISRLLKDYGAVNQGGIISYVEISPLMILPGARAADELWQALGLSRSGPLAPVQLDFVEASRVYCQKFCSVTRGEILKALQPLCNQCRALGVRMDVKGTTDAEAEQFGLA